MTQYRWENDPKLLAVVLARYKFAARMLEGKARVLEVGCADGFGSRIVRQHVGELVAIDIDAESIKEARRGASKRWPIDFRVSDVFELGDAGFDAVYLLDVIEHIEPDIEHRFLAKLRSFAPVSVIGAPSLESQPYASESSRRGHVNCKTGTLFRETLRRHWAQVFLFGMNDETLHTGFPPMAHYLLALCVA